MNAYTTEYVLFDTEYMIMSHRMLYPISQLNVMWNGLMQRIHCFFCTQVAAQGSQR